ncbi:hypothetical protein HYX12_02895 [Candidatus Woesearchaeota archaeon]|nr:hypothetical protein [Candidatus Woesearchaeota archaeon]
MKNRLLAGTLGLALILSAPVKAEEQPTAAENVSEKQVEHIEKTTAPNINGNIELVIGNQGGFFDAAVNVAVVSNTTISNRTFVEVDYSGEVTAFVEFLRGNYNVGEHFGAPGVGVTVGFLGGSNPFRPQAGVQYGRKIEEANLKLFQMVLASTETRPNLLSVTNLLYSPQFVEGVRGYFGVENLTNLGEEGHRLSRQHLRVEVCLDQVCAGLAVNLLEKGPEGKFAYNMGGGIRRNF